MAISLALASSTTAARKVPDEQVSSALAESEQLALVITVAEHTSPEAAASKAEAEMFAVALEDSVAMALSAPEHG